MWWIVGVVAVIALCATYATWTAARVDRLHARARSARVALESHLARRADTATDLADLLDRARLRDAAKAARDAPTEERESAENDLTRELRKLRAATGTGVLADVVASSRQVALTRQVYNDLVRDALAVRGQRLVRLLRLARRHPVPRYFDVDDPRLGDLPQR